MGKVKPKKVRLKIKVQPRVQPMEGAWLNQQAGIYAANLFRVVRDARVSELHPALMEAQHQTAMLLVDWWRKAEKRYE